MTATSITRIVVPSLVLVAACGAALAFGVMHVWREPPVETRAATAAPEVSPSVSGAPDPDKASAALATVQAEANAAAAALAVAPRAPDTDESLPAFDIARIERTGDAVIAGTARPGAIVELLRNGELHDRTVADKSGQFVMVPPRLPAGDYELTLASRLPDGRHATSRESVVVALAPNQKDRPVVALMTPDKPSVVLSKPAAPDSPGGSVAVDVVETEPGGKLHVSGHSPPGAAVRLYLNDSYLASTTAAANGRFAFTINEGVGPGGYRVRLDEVESASGAIRSRAEVPFSMPRIAAANGTGPSDTVGSSERRQPSRDSIQGPNALNLAGAGESQASVVTSASNAGASSVVVPKVATTVVSRGDSLWRISRAVYGTGERYSVIYGANHNQIRNPNRIYPGQVFVIPEKAR